MGSDTDNCGASASTASRHRSKSEQDKERHRDKDRDRDRDKDRHREKDRQNEKDRHKDKDRKDKHRHRDRSRSRDRVRDKDKDKDKDKDESRRSKKHEDQDRHRDHKSHRDSSRRLSYKAGSRHGRKDALEFEWVEKPTSYEAAEPEPVPSAARESWMLAPPEGAQGPESGQTAGNQVVADAFTDLLGAAPGPKDAAEAKPRNEFEMKISSMEINPYWRDGGKGLPPTQAQALSCTEPSSPNSSSGGSTISHFTLKKVERVIALAEEQGRPVEEVGEERFGSKQSFQEAYEVYNSVSRRRPRATRPSRLAQETGVPPPSSFTAAASASSAPPQAAAAAREEAGNDVSLDELVRQERRGGNGDWDRQLSRAITRDAAFQDDLEYLDDHAGLLSGTTAPAGGKHGKRGHTISGLGPTAGGGGTDAKRRKMGLEEMVRHRKATENCAFCPKEGRTLPIGVPVVSLGVQTYLSLVPYESVASCQIVPVEHIPTTLDGDDALWAEIRNFMKSLVRMYADQGKGVVFAEAAAGPRKVRHTAIDVIPCTPEFLQDARAHFREALAAAADEAGAQDDDDDGDLFGGGGGGGFGGGGGGSALELPMFDTRDRGGFRRALVPNLPYVHLWLDLDGGVAHVADARGLSGRAASKITSDQFVRAIVGRAEDVMPSLYRPQRWLPRQMNHDRVRNFLKHWEKHDWTKLLEGGDYAV